MFDNTSLKLVSCPPQFPCTRDNAARLLGPCRPLPVLLEITLRAIRDGVSDSRRLNDAVMLRARTTAEDRVALLTDLDYPYEIRLLSAICSIMTIADKPATLSMATNADRLPPAIASFLDSDDFRWYKVVLADTPPPSPAALPDPLVLLGFLKGLWFDMLSEAQFATGILDAGVLHPDVSRGRPLRLLGRLLDYLGFGEHPGIVTRFRRLARQTWPDATTENWARWAWITLPGTPESFRDAARAIAGGDVTLMRLHELRFAPLPASLDGLHPAVRMLAGWLRPVVRAYVEAHRWLTGTNTQASNIAQANPPWWEDWLRDGYPAAAQALAWLQMVPLPDLTPWACSRHTWLARYLLPEYPHIARNLLLAHAAAGKSLVTVRALAADDDLPAIRALGLAAPDDDTLATLHDREQHGSRPAQAAARTVLDGLARQSGLPDRRELARKQLLATAWEDGPLFDAPVRVGWEDGLFRLRLELHRGKVTLTALGPGGLLARIPAELQKSEAYREARVAQKDAQARYRLFRDHLERAMLDGAPMTAGQFRFLLANPLFSHQAERLVWQVTGGEPFLWAAPERWETLDGTPVAPADGLTLALVHPIALSAAGGLTAWQELAAGRRLVQPFKQLFREVYRVDGESGDACRRFAGRRVETHRAYALLKAAGYAPGSGVARREWPGGVTARLCWAEGARGRDLFGPHALPEAVTGDIGFTRDGARLPLHRVDAIIFSETLRAADLLTTRAAAGDAELTSRETIALRATLLRQLARSFGLTNIAAPEDGAYAVILGARATYRLNLANGAILLEPEGRQITLPPADPRWLPAEERDATTDILATAVTLASDAELLDLTFLAQL